MTTSRAAPYATVADCAFVELSRQYQAINASKLDSLGRTRLSYDVGGASLWTVDFVSTGSGTRIEYRTRPSIQGPTWNAQQLEAQIEGCGR